ncbi:MAG TPA: AAA family ATPase [Pirellulaceae bacterium]|nr:AAA family ATPase [Pirellulaceae bacterium]
MTTDLFRFRHRPFAAAADTANYVPFESIEAAIDATAGAVRREAGAAVVIGTSGLGKTMLCRVLAERLAESHEVVLLATSRLVTRRALLQNILFELGLPYRDREEGELRLGLLDHLRSRHNRTAGLLLLVDEAHTMPPRLLEELRALTNIVRDGRPRAHLVLVGNQSLDERLNHPKLDAIQQRIASRCYLYPMTRDETRRFVSRQWAQAIADETSLPFDAAALDRIHSAADGIPRLANQLCDHALMLANARRRPTIGAEAIDEAWSDLQQMPTPWQVGQRETPSGSRPTGAVIEFGTLDDTPPPSTLRALEADAFERLESMSALAEQALDADAEVDLETDDLASVEFGAIPAPPAEPEFVDPFAGDSFDDEEWVVVPKGVSVEPSMLRTPSPSTTTSSTTPTRPTTPAPRNAAVEFVVESSFDDAESTRLPSTLAFVARPDDGFVEDEPGEQFLLEDLQQVIDPFDDSGEYVEQSLMPGPPFTPVDPRATGRSDALRHSLEVDTPGRPEGGAGQVIGFRPHSAEASGQSGAKADPRTITGLGPRGSVADDKDLIVIDDPVPRNSLRIVAAPPQVESAAPIGPPSLAYREDYRSLFSRLRGDQDR